MPTQKTMDELAAAAARLNEKSAELNALIDDFDEALEKAGPGLCIWLEDDSRSPSEGWQIGYAKVDGKWRVAARQAAEKPIRLSNAPRIVRLGAVNHLEALAQAITSKVTMFADAVDRARATVARALGRP